MQDIISRLGVLRGILLGMALLDFINRRAWIGIGCLLAVAALELGQRSWEKRHGG